MLSVAHAIASDDDLVTDWLTSLGLGVYSTDFRVHGLNTVDQLMTLSRTDLQSVGVTDPRHLDTLLHSISSLVSTDTHQLTASHSPPHNTSPVVDRV